MTCGPGGAAYLGGTNFILFAQQKAKNHVIDFRYHIVSLISVFLALAVGIILGAGPLKETIGNQLTGQVEQLRAEKESMREELDAQTAARQDVEDYVSAASKRVVQDTLTDRRIAVVQTSDVPDALFEQVKEQLTNAGATVTARVSLTDAWTDPAQADARQSYASSLTEFLPENQQELPAEKALAAALIVAIAEHAETDADALSQNAALALDILDAADLVNLISYSAVPVDAVVIIDASHQAGAEVDKDQENENAEALAAASSLLMNVADAAARQTSGVVVAATDVVDNDLVSTIRANASAVKIVATVSDLGSPSGLLNAPLALAAAIGNKVGHFGFESSATALVPALVVLPEVDRTIELPETPPAEGDAAADDAAADATDQE